MDRIWKPVTRNKIKTNDIIRRNTAPNVVCRVVSITDNQMVVEYLPTRGFFIVKHKDTNEFYYEKEINEINEEI